MTCSQENLSTNSTYQIPHTYYRTFPQPSLILNLLRYGEYKILMTSQKIAKTFKNIQFQNLKNYLSEIFVADLHSASWEGVDKSLTVNEAWNCSQLSNIVLTEFEVAEVLRYLDPQKACGPDGIPSRLLVELADEIAPSLSKLLNMSLSLGVVPSKWKLANITPVFEADDPTLSSNYRPISLLCVLSKVLERRIHNHSYQHLAPLIYDRQHGFFKGK